MKLKIKNIIKLGDIFLLIIFIMASAAIYIPTLTNSEAGEFVVIKIRGHQVGSYPLAKDKTITLNKQGRLNKITIKDGKVQMKEANCVGQDCVKQGEIHETWQSIICLPNQVSVEIEGGEKKYDDIS